MAVIGDALLDVRVTPSSAIRAGADIPAEVLLEAGGQGANVAVRLARLGVPARLTCALGHDPAGTIVRAALAADGVDLRPITVEATGSVVVLLAVDGDRTMLSQRFPFVARLEEPAVAGAAWLIVSGYLLLEPDAWLLARLARLVERRAVVGCALVPPQALAWTSALRAIRPDLLVLNRDEASLLVGSDADTGALAADLAADLEAVTVVTDPEGAWLATGAALAAGGRVARTNAPGGGGPATDTTGAGDAFAAALVAELLAEPWPPTAEMLDRAMAAAARHASAVARTRGAQGRVAGEAPAGART